MEVFGNQYNEAEFVIFYLKTKVFFQHLMFASDFHYLVSLSLELI